VTARPTFLDRVRSRVTGTAAEVYAVRRLRESAQARKVFEQYDYAQAVVDMAMDRFGDDGWFPLGSGGFYPGRDGRRGGRELPIVFNETNLDFYRNASRMLYASNDYFRGLTDRVVDYECGRGFQWTPYRLGEKPIGDAEDLPPELQAAQAALDAFKRRDRWRSREREIALRGHRDGEAAVRLFRSAPGRPPAARFCEPEWIGRPLAAPDEYGPFSFGVLTHPDDVEKALAYHVRNPNQPNRDGQIVLAGGLLPDEEAETRELIAELVGDKIPVGPGRIHLFKCNVDRTQKRGLPTFVAAGPVFDSAAKLLRNTGDTATNQAAIFLIRTHTGGTQASVQTFADNFKDGTIKLPGAATSSGVRINDVPVKAQHGSHVVDSNDAIDYNPGPVSTGMEGFLSAHQALLRRGGCRVGAPEYLASGDASNGNYASTKEAGSPFVVATEGRQQDLADFEQDVADDILRMSIPEDGAGFDGVCVAVTPPPVAIRSELEVEQQRAVQHQAGVLSATTWQKQAGLKPEVEQANIAKEREANPDFGAMLQLPDDDPGLLNRIKPKMNGSTKG
jgi:hypothetical protein